MYLDFRRFLPVFLIGILCSQWLPAQTVVSKPAADSAGLTKNDTAVPYLVNKVEQYSLTIKQTNNLVKRTRTFTNITTELPDMEKRLNTFKSLLEKRGKTMNLRSLNSISIIVKETAKTLDLYENNLNIYSDQLAKSNVSVKKIISDPVLDSPVNDSSLAQQLEGVQRKAASLDSLERNTLSKVNLMRNRVSINLLKATDIISDLQYLTANLKMNMWKQEEPRLFAAKPSDYDTPLPKVISNAYSRSSKIIGIFVAQKWDVLTLAFMLFLFITGWSLSNMRRVKRLENKDTVLQQVHFFKRSVIAGSLMGFFTYAPLFLSNPTMSFLHAMELMRLLTLSIILIPYLSRQSKWIWAGISVLWLYLATDDILLESAYGERWALFFAEIFLAAICIRLLATRKAHFDGIPESPATRSLLFFTLIQVILSLIFNITGRESLAKIFGVSAVQCLMLGVTLKVFCTMVLEAIYLQSEAYQQSRFSEFINYKELEHRFRKVLWVFASIVWLIALSRNWSLYDWVNTLATNFIHETRHIGNMAFNFQSIAVFIFIIWFSTIISKFINFFFGHETAQTSGKRNRMGSMLLLIRLTIWALGFFIAIAAAGIPLDKLSIMIGALSVGIGFGLQNIVNNLVSGVILAFERPIQIGDQIEIGNKSGTVKEIGVRSSKIHNSEGADIIVPNGDLLSQHLINWTMQDRNKRVEFIIGVPYNADLNMVKTMIAGKLENNDTILHKPAPVIIVQAFVENAVQIRVIFWVPDLSSAGSLRSNVMIDVLQGLSAAGVELPCPPKS